MQRQEGSSHRSHLAIQMTGSVPATVTRCQPQSSLDSISLSSIPLTRACPCTPAPPPLPPRRSSA